MMNVLDSMMVLPVLPLADFFYAFKTSSFMSGKLIVTLLVGASVFAWSVMLTKRMELKRASDESKRFLDHFRRIKGPVDLFLENVKYPASPLYSIYDSACQAMGLEISSKQGRQAEMHYGDRAPELSEYQLNTIRNAAERQVADQALVIENRMGFLATAVSVSPMLGLLGTVWGVMDSFVSMAIKGMVNLQAIAPGIAGALLTTVVGLLVAIPSAIGYNMLTSRIRTLSVMMDNFKDELMAGIQREYLKDNG